MKKLVLSVVFCSTGLFGMQCLNVNRHLRNVTIDEVDKSEVFAFLRLAAANRSLENAGGNLAFERGKIASEKVVIEGTLNIALNLPKEKLIAMHDVHKKMDLGRYQPKEQEVIRYVCDIANPVVSDVVATMIVAKHYEDRLSVAKMHRPTVQPKQVAIALADNAVKEGLYYWICAEVHKHEFLSFAHDYFPASNHPEETKGIKKWVVKIIYEKVYGKARSALVSAIPQNKRN